MSSLSQAGLLAVSLCVLAVVPTAVAAAASTTTSKPVMVTVAVPWVSCPTQFGLTGPHARLLPATLKVKIAPALEGKVAVYSNNQGQMTLVAPMGWACNATVGADGQRGVSVFPPAHRFANNYGGGHVRSNAQAVVGHETASSSGPTLTQACPLFPTARHLFSHDNPGLPRDLCPSRPAAGETTHRLSSGVISFRDPPRVVGDGYPSGGPYAALGVMTYHSQTANGSWLETCTLPAGDASLCRASESTFVSDYGSF